MESKEDILQEIKDELRLQAESEKRVEALGQALRQFAPIQVGDKVQYNGNIGWISSFNVSIYTGDVGTVRYYPINKAGGKNKRARFLTYSANGIEVLEKNNEL